MGLKNFWAKITNWLKTPGQSYNSSLSDEGLIRQEKEKGKQDQPKEQAEEPKQEKQPAQPEQPHIVARSSKQQQAQSVEKLQENFTRLVDQIGEINQHLGEQVERHEALMQRMDRLPHLLESLPEFIDNQKRLSEQLNQQLKTNAIKEQQFVDAVQKIPLETVRQTESLSAIERRMATAAELDDQMNNNLRHFNSTLEKLDQSTGYQTDSIMHMSKTFATSDRYLKYLISKQNRRFMWMFIFALGITLTCILVLAGVIIYLRG